VGDKFVVGRPRELDAFRFGLHLSSGRAGVLDDRLVDDVIDDAVLVPAFKVAPRYVSHPAGKPTRLARPTVLVCTNTTHNVAEAGRYIEIIAIYGRYRY